MLALNANMTIAPVMKEYILRGLNTADQRNTALLVIQLNTPGGAIGTTMKIIEDLRASRMTVVIYVSPRGHVQVQSEQWSAELAEDAEPIQKGE